MSESFEGPLSGLGELLRDRRLRYELLAIGGGALISRIAAIRSSSNCMPRLTRVRGANTSTTYDS
jgi:hypothetical protein